MITVTPVLPAVGEKVEIEGDAETVNVPLVALPPGVVTLIGPVVAPTGEVVVICVSLRTANEATVPLKSTCVAPVSPLPVIVTLVPVGPLVGEILAMTGDPAR